MNIGMHQSSTSVYIANQVGKEPTGSRNSLVLSLGDIMSLIMLSTMHAVLYMILSYSRSAREVQVTHRTKYTLSLLVNGLIY